MAIRTHYPDPDSVLIPSTLPPRYACHMTTRSSEVVRPRYPIHRHGAWVDKAGNGNTDASDTHYHYIRDGRVLPDPRDGHTHDITNLPCGAG